MQITRKRFAEERADHQRQLQTTEEQQRAYNLQQERKFNAEQIRINDQISNDKYERDQEIKIAAEKTERKEAENRARMEEVIARTDRRDQESRELLERLFQSLHTQTPLICDGTAASVSALTAPTDTSTPSRKRTKLADNLTAMTSRMDSSDTSTETNPVSAESLSENYNPPDPSPRTAKNHDARKRMNKIILE